MLIARISSQYRVCVLPSVEPVPFAEITISAVGGVRPKAGKKTISALGRDGVPIEE